MGSLYPLLWTFLHLSIVTVTANAVPSADPTTYTDHSTEKLPRILRRRDQIENTKETGPISSYHLPIVDTIQQPHWPAMSESELMAKENTDDVLYLGNTSEVRISNNNEPKKTCTSEAQAERLDYEKTEDLPTYRTSNEDIQTLGLLLGKDSLVTQTRNESRMGVLSPGVQISRTASANVWTVDSEESYANQVLRATKSTNQVTDRLRIPNKKIPQTVYPNIETIGGVGNPSLKGIPISLDDEVFLIQYDNRTVTDKPIYGGVGAEFLPLSVDTGGIRSINPNKEFFTIPNKAPYHILSPPTSPKELFPNFSGVHFHKTSGQNLLPATNRPVSISSLIDIVKNLTSQTRKNSITPTPSPYAVNPHSYSFSAYNNDLPNFSLQKKVSMLPSETKINIQDENLNDYFWKEYEENSNGKQSFHFPNVLSPLQSSKAFPNNINNFSNISFNRELPLSSSFKNSDESPVGINNSIQGCLKDTWCGLGIAAAVAFGTVSAIAVPFLAPPVFGRKRKSIEYVLISIDNASSFAEHYMSMLQNNTSDVPYHERMLFIGLHDSDNNSTRDTFEKIKELILNNRDILLPITEHQFVNMEKTTGEDSDKNQIIIPDSILNKIIEKSEDLKSEFPINKQAAHNREDERTSLKEDTNLSQIQQLDILPGLSDNPKQTPQDHFPSNIPESAISSHAKDVNNDVKILMDKNLQRQEQDALYLPPGHNSALERGQNKGTNMNLKKNDFEISHAHSSFHPRQRVPTPHYIQTQKVGTIPEPLAIPYQLHQNENNKYSMKNIPPKEPLGSSGSILQRLSERLTGNYGQAYTQHSLPLQANFPATPLAGQIGHNSRYSPIDISDTLPERYPLSVGANIYTPFTQNQNLHLMNNFKLSPFSSFGLNRTPINTGSYYDSLPNHNIGDLRNTAIKNASPAISNQVTSTQLPQEVQGQPTFGHSSILLNLPVPFIPNQQVNNLNNVNLSSPVHLKPKPHLPSSLSISNLLNRITKYPSRLNGSLKPITNTNPTGMAHPYNSLSQQIPRPSQMVPSQVSFSSFPKPIQTNKISHFFTSNPYNSYPYPNPAYSTSGNPQLVPLKDTGQNVSLHAKGFYQSVCSAVGHKDVPNSDIIRFIREKCTIFQYTGII